MTSVADTALTKLLEYPMAKKLAELTEI